MNDEPIKQQLDTYPPIRSFENTMRLITDEQHAQIVEALNISGEHRRQAALATLQALPEVEVAAYASYGEQINKPLYATKEPA